MPLSEGIDLDNTIDLGIEPFYVVYIPALSMCQSDDTPFPFILRELPDVFTVSISEGDERLDNVFHRSVCTTMYLVEGLSF